MTERRPHTLRRRVESVMAPGLLVWLSTNAVVSVHGQQSVEDGLLHDGDFVRWALTQGGLTVLLCVVLWSYRRDLARADLQKDQTIEVLTDLVKSTTQTSDKVVAVVEALTVEVRRLGGP